MLKAEDRSSMANLRANAASLEAAVDPRPGFNLMVVGEILRPQIYRTNDLTIEVDTDCLLYTSPSPRD